MKTLAFPLFVLLVLPIPSVQQPLAASVVEPGSQPIPALEMPAVNVEQNEERGRICLAPLVHPVEGFPATGVGGIDENPAEVEEAAPSEEAARDTQETMGAESVPPPGMVAQPIFVEAEKNGRIPAEPDRALSLGPLSLDEEHLVKVWEDDKIIQAFLVSFAGSNPRELCVFYREAREAWVVVPMEDVAAWCTCDHSAYVPPRSEEELLELENQTDETDRAPADPHGETSR